MEEKRYDNQKAKKLLEEMGIEPYFRGYQITLMALERINENEECLCAVGKEICLPIAKRLQCKATTVDAAIRRTSERAWSTHPDIVRQITGKPLDGRPAVRLFLFALYSACRV